MSSTSTLPWLGSAPPAAPPRPRRRRAVPITQVRRIAAALLVGIAAWLVIGAVRPPPPPHTVLTVTADLPAGHQLTASDVTQARVADPLHPAGALERPDQAVGKRLARATPGRSILTADSLSSARDLTPQERALHVPVADPGAILSLRPGDRVDLVEGAGGRVVARSVRVLAVDDPTADKSGHGILVAAAAAEITSLVPAMAASGAGVTPVLRTE